MLAHTLSRFAGVRKQERSLIPRDDVEKALASLCTPPLGNNKLGTRPSINDGVFHHIAKLLKHLELHLQKQGWSSRPRTYVVLRYIGCADLMPAFIALGLKDFSFPYTLDKLPEVLVNDTLKDRFMDAQKCVLTDATQIENGAHGVHAHTKNGEDLYFVVRHLGSGGYG